MSTRKMHSKIGWRFEMGRVAGFWISFVSDPSIFSLESDRAGEKVMGGRSSSVRDGPGWINPLANSEPQQLPPRAFFTMGYSAGL